MTHFNPFFRPAGCALVTLALLVAASAAADDLDDGGRPTESRGVYAGGWAGAGAEAWLLANGLVVMPDPGFVLDPNGLVVMPDPGFLLDAGFGVDRAKVIFVARGFIIEIEGVNAGHFASPSRTDGYASGTSGDRSEFATARVVLRGDLDGDGTVTVEDAVVLQRSLQGHPPASACEAAADADSDGTVGTRDVLQILRWATGEECHPATTFFKTVSGLPMEHGLVDLPVDGSAVDVRVRFVVVQNLREVVEYHEGGENR